MTSAARPCLLLVASALAGCLAIGDGAGDRNGDGDDGGGSGSVARPDASVPASLDAGGIGADAPAPPDAAVEPEPIPARVTASCLFLRQGPGSNQPKIRCVPGGPECNADNDVCMPQGDIFEVTGGPATGAGCTEWFPGDYKEYEGYACGEYLEFPSSARLRVRKGATRYPGLMEGPKG
jgi:hypothetical protein